MPQGTLFNVKVSEAEVQKAIIQFLKLKGIFVYRQNAGAFKVGDRFVSMGKVGIADVICITHGGKYTAIEVKTPKKGVLSPAQVEFLRDVRKAGGIAMVATSVDDVVRLLENQNAKSEDKYEKLLSL